MVHIRYAQKTLLFQEKQKICMYATLIAYIKKQSVGFEPTKSATFSKAEVPRFLSKVPDVDYLTMKVALVIGIMGAYKSQELTDIKNEDLREEGSLIVITLPKTKTRSPSR
ncbi:uncharacterized protein LOC117172420 [Belonocnema kinseyi]|uniref:uncharacterized protein LOC117172420 n=1 Tax=Belonocnema kinseyi TaxID=2817044 RepID=UPI00143D2034|nr:uncharacterized protein LOC117172420 [Belonocnema kinseyi]